MTTTTNPVPDIAKIPEDQEEFRLSVPPGPSAAVDERIEPAADGYLKVDTTTGYRADGTSYEHTRVRVGTGFGALVIPFVRHRGMVYLAMVHQHRPVLGRDSWEFVRGGTGNHSQEEANRELREETGLKVENTSLRQLGVLHPDTGLLDVQVGVWVAPIPMDQVSLTRRHVEQESGAQVRWMGVGQVAGLILNKEMVCGMSLAAYAMADAAGIFHQAI